LRFLLIKKITMIKPTFIDRKIVYNGPWQTIHCDHLETYTGTRIDYYVVNHRDAVAALPVTDDGKLVMIEQYRHPVSKFVLDIPGGLIDPGEKPENSIKREILEETGYQTSHIEYLSRFCTDPSMSPQEIILYKASGLVKVSEAKREDSTPIKVHLLPPDIIRDAIYKGHYKNLSIISSWTMISLLFYLNSLNTG